MSSLSNWSFPRRLDKTVNGSIWWTCGYIAEIDLLLTRQRRRTQKTFRPESEFKFLAAALLFFGHTRMQDLQPQHRPSVLGTQYFTHQTYIRIQRGGEFCFHGATSPAQPGMVNREIYFPETNPGKDVSICPTGRCCLYGRNSIQHWVGTKKKNKEPPPQTRPPRIKARITHRRSGTLNSVCFGVPRGTRRVVRAAGDTRRKYIRGGCGVGWLRISCIIPRRAARGREEKNNRLSAYLYVRNGWVVILMMKTLKTDIYNAERARGPRVQTAWHSLPPLRVFYLPARGSKLENVTDGIANRGTTHVFFSLWPGMIAPCGRADTPLWVCMYSRGYAVPMSSSYLSTPRTCDS